MLWLTVAALFYFRYLQYWRPVHFYAVTGALILAALTKGIAGLLVLPALAIFTLVCGKLVVVLKRKELYLGIFAFLVVVLGYYALREISAAGYLKAVAENELGGRYLTALEGHKQPWYFYFLGGVIFPWTVLVPLLAVFIFRHGSPYQKQFCLYGLLYVGLFLLVISSAETKLSSYDAPIYPMVALVVGTGLYEAYKWLVSYFQIRNTRYFAPLLLILVFAAPYFLIMKRVVNFVNKDHDPETRYGYIMRELRSQRPELTRYTIVEPGGYNPPLAFYQQAFNKEGHAIQNKLATEAGEFTAGQLVLACDTAILEQLQNRYAVTKVHQTKQCQLLKINGSR